nr:hypothetical protein [Francisella persica]
MLNDTVVDYIETGKFNLKASIETLSNAVDVGNLERLLYLLTMSKQFVPLISKL